MQTFKYSWPLENTEDPGAVTGSLQTDMEAHNIAAEAAQPP